MWIFLSSELEPLYFSSNLLKLPNFPWDFAGEFFMPCTVRLVSVLSWFE